MRVNAARRRAGRGCDEGEGEPTEIGCCGARAAAGQGLRGDDAGGVRARPASDRARSPRSRPADPRAGSRPTPRPPLDLRRLIRRRCAPGATPSTSPEPRKEVPRKLVVLCDVSGSMDAYARALLLFLHARSAPGRGVEAFALRHAAVAAQRPTSPRAIRRRRSRAPRRGDVDWGSGTRIGASLKEFNDRYGRRALSRGAVVVIVSDGWERRIRSSSAARWPALARGARGRLGEPAQGQPRVSAARGRDARGPAARRPPRRRPQPREPRVARGRRRRDRAPPRGLARRRPFRVVELEEVAHLGQPALLDEADVGRVVVVPARTRFDLRTPSRSRSGSRSSGSPRRAARTPRRRERFRGPRRPRGSLGSSWRPRVNGRA